MYINSIEGICDQSISSAAPSSFKNRKFDFFLDNFKKFGKISVFVVELLGSTKIILTCIDKNHAKFHFDILLSSAAPRWRHLCLNMNF